MTAAAIDITKHIVKNHEAIGISYDRVMTLELLRDSVVQPSLRSLDREISAWATSDQPGAAFHEADLAEVFQTTVESYLLAVQALWERALRSMLVSLDRAAQRGTQREVIQRATWQGGKGAKGLMQLFEHLVGVPISAFDSYRDLDLLQNFGSAIRHGDGLAARRIYERCPNLWWNFAPPGMEIVFGDRRLVIPHDRPKHPSFESITLKEVVLQQMIQSVLWFWQDIDRIRCNSFSRKPPEVIAQLEAWPAERSDRKAARVWNEDDPL